MYEKICFYFTYFLKKYFIYLFLEREEGREKERERTINVRETSVVSRMSPTGDLACSPGMCPDWESNR